MVDNIDFICVGAQKAGTTPLFDIIKKHSQINIAPKKEVHYFDRDVNYQKGEKWYFNHFESLNKVTGEVTPDYLFYDYVPERIKETLGNNIKILIMLRDPVLRTYSQYNFYRLKGVEFNSSFDYLADTKESELTHINTVFNTWYAPPYYIERSQYYHQVKRYIDIFGKDNIYICIYENFFKQGNVNDIEWSNLLEFLGVNYESPIPSKPSNVSYVPKKGIKGKLLDKIRRNKWLLDGLKKVIPMSIYKPLRTTTVTQFQEKPSKMNSEVANKLYKKYFEEDIIKLETLTSMDLSIWKAKYL